MTTCEQADDSERLILEYFDAIRDSPSHIYHSALPFSPSSSWIRKCYEAEVVGEVRVLMGLPDQWDTCSRTILLEGKPSAFAYWGDVIAVGLESRVELLDAITGIRTSVLCGHRSTIPSLTFALDGTLLLSRSDDKTAILWDVQTGGAIRTIGEDTSVVSASISPDGTTIALGTRNGTLHMWDVRTWKCHSISTGQDSKVMAIIFSPIDSRRLLSSSWHGTVRQWGVDGHQIGTSYHEADRVDDLSYALDGTRFVSCGGKIATIRDSESGALVVKLHAPDQQPLFRCCFSSEGRFVACTAGKTICIWDITIPGARLVRQFVGHSNSVPFITFSSSLISGSWDRTVKIWQGSSFMTDSTATDRMAALDGSTPIVSASLFAKDGTVVTSDSSGMVKTWDLVTGVSKSSFSTPANGERATYLAGDSLIIVWCTDEEMEYHVWDVYKGQLLRKFRSSLTHAGGLKMSGDGSKLFGLGFDWIEALSMETGEEVGRAELGFGEGSSFFVHGSRVGIDNLRDRGWDFGGPKVSDFGEFPDRPRLDLVNRSAGREIRWIEDTVTKRLVFRLPERYLKSDTEVEWDGRYLLVWSRSGAVVIVDFDSVRPAL